MFKIMLPKKLNNLKQALLYQWLKDVGEKVERNDLICLVQAGMELFQVKSGVSGVLLEILVHSGGVFEGAMPLAILGKKGDNVSAVIEKFVSKAPVSVAKPSQNQEIEKITPLSKPGDRSMDSTNSASAAPSGAVIPILMPQAGQTMEEGTILSWKAKEGDRIEVGQIIMEIETDKATMEVEATDAGRIGRIINKEGDIVEVKKPVAFIADNDADIDAYLAAEGMAAPVPETQSASIPATTDAKPTASVPEGDVTPILMPQAGQTMEEGTILSWKVKEGDRIEVGQVIMEIETDKATMEVEAVDAGRVAKIVSQEGDIVEVKVPVAYLAEEGVDINAYLTSAGVLSKETSEPAASTPVAPTTSSVSTTPKTAAAVSQSGRIKASPAARKAAKDKGIDLASIRAGSGPGGRIISIDVEKADVAPTEMKTHTLSKMRRAIANNLLYSKQNVPHFYAKITVDAGLLFSTYRKTKEQFKCTVNDFVTRACAKAVRQYPVFRSQYKGTEIIEKPSVNIGIAVGTDEGLTVPVVVDADRMNLEQLSARTRQVVESARNGKLEGMGQGIFTITNLGMFGVEEFSAIINPPESAILAVGAIREGVVVENGDMRPTRLMTVTLSVDHRVIDGVLAAQFLKTLKELLENPEQLVS